MLSQRASRSSYDLVTALVFGFHEYSNILVSNYFLSLQIGMFSIKKISLSCFDENRWKKYFVYGYKKERINIPIKKLYFIECNTCRIFDKTLGLSII